MSNQPAYTLISPKQFKERISRSLETRIGIHAIYNLVKRKDFPSVKIGGQYYIIENRVDEWLQSQSTKRKV